MTNYDKTLAYLRGHHGELFTCRELSERTGVHYSKIHRIMRELSEEGYCEVAYRTDERLGNPPVRTNVWRSLA